jgi:hypothetical protein
VGVVTDCDITVRAVAEGRDPVTTQVREVMTADVIYRFDNQDVKDAARLPGLCSSHSYPFRKGGMGGFRCGGLRHIPPRPSLQRGEWSQCTEN